MISTILNVKLLGDGNWLVGVALSQSRMSFHSQMFQKIFQNITYLQVYSNLNCLINTRKAHFTNYGSTSIRMHENVYNKFNALQI